MAFQMVGDQLKSLETVTFNNKTKPPRTFMNPEGNFRFSKASGNSRAAGSESNRSRLRHASGSGSRWKARTGKAITACIL